MFLWLKRQIQEIIFSLKREIISEVKNNVEINFLFSRIQIRLTLIFLFGCNRVFLLYQSNCICNWWWSRK